MRRRENDRLLCNGITLCRTVSLLLALLIMVGVTGCGGNDVEGVATSDSNTPQNAHTRERTISIDEFWGSSWEETIYDHRGNPIVVFWGSGGLDLGVHEVSHYAEYTYDALGNEVAYHEYKENSHLELVDWRYSTYDIDGNLLQTKIPYNIDDYIIMEYDLNGNVVKEYYYDEDAAEGDYYGYYEYVYDDNGRLMTVLDYDSDGQLEESDEYYYNENGFLSQIVSSDYYGGEYGGVNWRQEFTYDDDGNLVTESSYDRDGDECYRDEYVYDALGNELNYIAWDVDHVLEEDYEVEDFRVSEYDENGNLTLYRHEGAAGRTEYTYDEYNNLLTETSINGDDETFSRISYNYEYDSLGNILSTEGYLEREVQRAWTENGESFSESNWEKDILYRQVFDEDGKELELYLYDKSGELRIHSESTYDRKGNELRTVEYDAEGNVLYTIEYSYDKKGNEIYGMILDGEGNEVYRWNYPGAGSDESEKQSASQHPAESFKKVSVGDEVFFGSYEQDGIVANGLESIEWLVLAKEENRVLIISKYGLDSQPYNTDKTEVTWENCTLRTWLNTDFLSTAFSELEQTIIEMSTIPAALNPEYDTEPGNATQDKVFLLSIDEAEEYFLSDDDRKCEASAYVDKQGAFVNSEGICCWWLRSPGENQADASQVDNIGSVDCYGVFVSSNLTAVRPVLWINLDS